MGVANNSKATLYLDKNLKKNLYVVKIYININKGQII